MIRILLALLSVCCSLSLSAQKIHFTDTSNVWSELHLVTAAPSALYYSTYYFINDTTFDSIRYRHFNFAIIREDTILKKVYIRNVASDTDAVLMDYSLNAGDTFNFDASVYYTCQYVVASVDSTLINSVWHKVWYFSRILGSDVIPWTVVVEGIGSLDDPCYMIMEPGVVGEYADYMYCFSNRGIRPPLSPPVGDLDNVGSCSYYSTLYTPQVQLNKNKITIYPNPATSQLAISASSVIDEVTIINLLGQKVYSHQYHSTQVTVDISQQPTGVYFVKVNNEVRKFIKE